MRTVTIVGQGYVGLPLAFSAVQAGWVVRGLDTSSRVVDRLNSGLSHIDDLEDSDIQTMLSAGYSATSDPAVVGTSEVVVICVPTPLADGGAPDLSAVRAATRMVGQNLNPGTVFILESTTYPGTTEEVCIPILEEESGLIAGTDFSVAFSPERVNPGVPEFGISNTPKLIGGIDRLSLEKGTSFYQSFIDEVVPMSGTREAETAKLLENTFRHVNIALINEMAKFCHELGIDIWDVIDGAATKPFGFMKFTPGPGVGGHCIPIDPNYLSYEVRKELGYPFRFVELAQEINNSMPAYVVSRVQSLLNDVRKPVNGAKILLLGITYKKDIADQRQSPAVPLARQLIDLGATVRYHDPFVAEWNVSDDPSDDEFTIPRETDLNGAARDADIVVLLQPHSAYNLPELASMSSVFFDAVGATDGSRTERL